RSSCRSTRSAWALPQTRAAPRRERRARPPRSASRRSRLAERRRRSARQYASCMAVEPTPEELIEHPAEAVEVERETRMTPAEATARMRIRVPTRGNRKLRSLIERVNADDELKAWWHVSNVNAIGRLSIN